ncbi:MAG: hypothetical protein AAGH99_16325 [Planctomycetota bacterium]
MTVAASGKHHDPVASVGQRNRCRKSSDAAANNGNRRLGAPFFSS